MDTNDPLAHVLNARLVYHLPGEDQVPAIKNIAFKTVDDLTLHLDGHHGFDTEDPDERSREIIRQTLDFFQAHLMRG